MALLAVKHLDPVVGVDVHSVLVTPGTPPVFLPHPHVGFMLDKREYIEAAKAVVGCIATMIVQEKVNEYLEDHLEDVTKLEHLADEANQQVNELMGGGKLPDFKNDPNVAEGMKLANEANKIKNRISDDIGSNVGAGGSSGRPIFVNGMMRATAGTHAYHVPGLHFPLGESFAPPPEDPEPSNDGESFMGSKTVLANNDPMSYMALEALSCWSIGMEPPPHNSAHTDRTYPSMPSSVMLPIPAGRPVLVGGPPIVNMAAAAKGLFKAFQGSKWAKALADKLNLKSGFLRCNVLKAEPVDVRTGEVVVQQSDFTVWGRLPLVWRRYYSGHAPCDGVVGAGWQTPADIRFELMQHEQTIGAVACFPDHTTAFDLLPASDGWAARRYDWQYGYALYLQGGKLTLRTRDGIEYGFVLPRQWMQTVDTLKDGARLVVPIERMADLNGNAWLFERDTQGRVARIAEWTTDGPTSRCVECRIRDEDHTSSHHGAPAVAWLSALTFIAGDGSAHHLVSYEQDDAQNLRAAINAMAQPHRFDYTDSHRMVKHTSARGVSFYYSYCVSNDGIWRVDRAWGDKGLFDYCFSYDLARRETGIIDSRGYKSVLQLNEQNMPVAEIDPLGGVTSYRYDTQGRANAQTDPVGRTIRWDYDKYGNEVAQTLPDGSTIKTEYDINHRPICVTSIGGRKQRLEWDASGNLLAQISPSGATSHYAYDGYGQLVEHMGPLGSINRFGYDRDGNLSETVNALGHRTGYRYDSCGNLVETIDALGQRSIYTYDRNGNLIFAIEPGGREVHCAYDADGNLIRYRDPAGYVTRTDNSALGEIVRWYAPDGTAVEYQYDTEEQLVGVVNERGDLYTLERDALGRIVVETDYWGQVRRYQYDAVDELIRSTDPLGQTVEYLYDQLGRIVQRRILNQFHDEIAQVDNFTYDRNGDLVVAENSSCRVEFRYDEDGRVVDERQGDDFTITSDYDLAGNRTLRRTQFVVDGGTIEHTVRYTFDAQDTLVSIQIDDALPTILNHDALAQVRTENLTNKLQRERSYESNGQLASQRTLLVDAGVLFASEYAYDANGETIEKHDTLGGRERFRYDPVGRITAHIDPTGVLHQFIPDPTGDLLKTSIHEHRSVGVAGDIPTDTWVREGEYDGCYFAYNKTGNLIRKRHATMDLTLHWDAAGQLVETLAVQSVTEESEKILPRIRAQYEYDAFQRRVKKTVHAQEKNKTECQPPSRIIRFFWDTDFLIGEYSTNFSCTPKKSLHCNDCHSETQPISSEEKRIDKKTKISTSGFCEWIYYSNTFQPFASIHRNELEQQTSTHPILQSRNAEIIYFYQNDPNGAPVRMHDATGNIVWEATYSPTGQVRPRYFSKNQPIRLQGQYFDEESGLYYNRHRYFDVKIGQFISHDPIGLEGGTNPYEFAINILIWIDPFGLAPELYYLVANKNGFYDVMTWGKRSPTGKVYLRRGEIWKIGETIVPKTRYSGAWLARKNLSYKRVMTGPTKSRMQIWERLKIDKYVKRRGRLPPGNKCRH